MLFKVQNINEVDWDVLEKITPYSLFSETKTLKACMDVFENNYKFALLEEDGQVKAYLPLVIENQHVNLAGYFGDHDLFDFSPLNFIELKYLQELINKLINWTKENGMSLILREFPVEIVNLLKIQNLKISSDAIVPVCNIECNSQAQEGKPIYKKKHRKEMRRKLNRINAENINYKIELETTNKAEAKAKFLEFFSKSQNDEKQKFIESKAKEYFDKFLDFQEIKLSTMYFNEKLVSVLVYFENQDKWFRDKAGRKVLYLYNMASDPEYYDYSPGLIHVNSIIMDVIKAGYDEFNFLRGAERYKFEIGANACNWNIKLEL
ncbi:GNAT family N-acetyltransferase [Candidatus Dojkabacteria bacterium]|nr:GNAT family N-acetyltransferase [Candidatus Dojkabacteria bacterium]